MPREIRVYSISVVDLLCCALGGTVLVCFLLIVSISQSAKAGFPHAFFLASGGVWLDVTEPAARVYKSAGKEADFAKLMKEPGPLASTDQDLLKGMLAECEVQLELHWRPGKDTAVPRDKAKPLFVANTSREGASSLPPQVGATVTSRTEGLGLRRVVVKNEPRLFAAYLLHLAAFKTQRGWYFLRLAVIKQPTPGGLGKETAAWLRVESGGRPGEARFQTHADIEDVGWPEKEEIAAVMQQSQQRGGFGKLARPTPQALQERMQRVPCPDLFLPGWPGKYPVENQEPGPTRFVFRAADQGTKGWMPYFAIRHARGTPLPDAARFPVIVAAVESSPGWHERAEEADVYLPGFRIEEVAGK
jgi:hypothetical protein